MKTILVKETSKQREILIKCLPAFVCIDKSYIKYFMSDYVFEYIKKCNHDKETIVILEGIENVTNYKELNIVLDKLKDNKVYVTAFTSEVSKELEDMFEVKTIDEIIES